MTRPTALRAGAVVLLGCAAWHTPLNLLPEPGGKTRGSIGRRGTKPAVEQAVHDDTCGNCTVLKTGPDRFLVAYSDFRHINAAGQRCKAICVREVRVNR